MSLHIGNSKLSHCHHRDCFRVHSGLHQK